MVIGPTLIRPGTSICFIGATRKDVGCQQSLHLAISLKLESNQLPAVDLIPHSIVLPTHINVCLSRLSLKFLRDDSVNVGHLYNTAADFCSSVRELHSSVGGGFPRSPVWAGCSRNEMRMVERAGNDPAYTL